MNQQNQKYPRVSVKAVFRHQDSVLYYKTTTGISDIPGGHIEFGETIFEALKRELQEEIGYMLKTEPKLLHAWTYLSRDKSAHRVYIVYLIELLEKVTFKSLEYPGEIEFMWVQKNEIATLDMMSELKDVLLKAY